DKSRPSRCKKLQVGEENRTYNRIGEGDGKVALEFVLDCLMASRCHLDVRPQQEGISRCRGSYAAGRQASEEIATAEVSHAFQVVQCDAGPNGQLEKVLTIGRRRHLQSMLHLLDRIDIPAVHHVGNDVSLCCRRLSALSQRYL